VRKLDSTLLRRVSSRVPTARLVLSSRRVGRSGGGRGLSSRSRSALRPVATPSVPTRILPLIAATAAVSPFTASTEALRARETKGLELLRGEGQQGQLAGALDGRAQPSLMLGAGSGRASRLYPRSLRQVSTKPVDVLVVNVLDLIDAKLTGLAPVVAGPVFTPRTALTTSRRRPTIYRSSHFLSLLMAVPPVPKSPNGHETQRQFRGILTGCSGSGAQNGISSTPVSCSGTLPAKSPSPPLWPLPSRNWISPAMTSVRYRFSPLV